MARNQEKAMSMLNRWTTMKSDELKGPEERRPRLASSVKTINEAEKWRGQLIREISKNLSLIQDGSKGESRIRDLNDQINKLIRIKHHWERRIRELGGADYVSGAPRMTDKDGTGALGEAGYYYFGAAKELPGVRELFEKKIDDARQAEKRADLHKLVDAEYYGFYDEDDDDLVALELAAEQRAHAEALRVWREEGGDDKDGDEGRRGVVVNRSYVNVPSQHEIQEMLLAKRKREVMEKYGSNNEQNNNT